MKHLRSLAIEPDKTMYQVCNEFIKPTTAADKVSYAELMSGTEHVAARADVFVSYAWGYTWEQILSALEDAGHGSSYVWLDAFIVNQHHALDKELEDWLRTFKTGVEQIGHVVVILAPWDDPVYVKRAWCVFETIAALDAKVKREVVFPPSEKSELVAAMREGIGHANLTQIFADVNVARCQAVNPVDRDAILALIGSRTDVNDAVMGPLKGFYTDVMVTAVARMPGMRKEEGLAFNAVASLFKALGDLDAALPWFDKALEAHRCVGSGSSDEDVATALNNLAQCLRDVGEYDEALTLMREALALDRRALGEDHPSVAIDLNNIAECLVDQGDYGEALRVHYEALDMHKRWGGGERASHHCHVACEHCIVFGEARQIGGGVGEAQRRVGDAEVRVGGRPPRRCHVGGERGFVFGEARQVW